VISVCVGDAVLTPKHHVRNLGVIFDQHLLLTDQINLVCRTCYNNIRNIGRIRRFISADATKALMQGLVLSRLDYCNAMYGGLASTLIMKLQRVQNMAARIITQTDKYDHITPVLIDLHWLPIARRIQFKILVYTYKSLNALAPEYLCDMVKVYKPRRSLRSATTGALVVPRSKTIFYGNAQFNVLSATLWNSLPANVIQSQSLLSFRKELKTHLFTSEYLQ